jgi:hypothetical protein
MRGDNDLSNILQIWLTRKFFKRAIIVLIIIAPFQGIKSRLLSCTIAGSRLISPIQGHHNRRWTATSYSGNAAPVTTSDCDNDGFSFFMNYTSNFRWIAICW